MELSDILPDRFNYDKMRPPRLEGQPAKVFNHLTVMGLDSINENSMVSQIFFVPNRIYAKNFRYKDTSLEHVTHM